MPPPSCLVVEDYLTNPYQPSHSAMTRVRSQSVRLASSHGTRPPQMQTRSRSSAVATSKSVFKHPPTRTHSFSPGSFSVKEKFNSFRSRSSSVSSFSSSCSSTSSHTSESSEQFWNQYRRNRPSSSLTKLIKRALTNRQASQHDHPWPSEDCTSSNCEPVYAEL